MFVGPSDVGGACPSGVEIHNKVGADHCCCGSDSCCWARCIFGAPPNDCLPHGAVWKFNDNRGYFEAVQATSDPTSTSTVAPSGKFQNYFLSRKVLNVM